jgi:hypothetical protein
MNACSPIVTPQITTVPARMWRRQQLSALALRCAGTEVIGENDTWTEQDVISDVDALEDHHLVF